MRGIPIRIIATSSFEHLCCNGHSGVDRISDDENHGLGAVPAISELKIGTKLMKDRGKIEQSYYEF